MITTPRLRLRAFTLDDLPALLSYRGDPEVARYQGWLPYDSEGGHAFIAKVAGATLGSDRWVNLAVELRSSGDVIGDVGLCGGAGGAGGKKAELGFSFARASWGRGLAREAAGALIDHAFTALDFATICAVVDARNLRAERLLLALGFRQVGRDVDVLFKGERCDELRYERAR